MYEYAINDVQFGGKMHNYKIVMADFDGTLLNDKKKIGTRTKKIFNELKKGNIYIIGVTARTLNSVKQVIQIDLFDYLILNNGANIFDVKNNQFLYTKELSKDICSEIHEKFKEYIKAIDFCDGFNYYKYSVINNIENNFIININDIKKIYDKQIVRMNIFLKNQMIVEGIKIAIESEYKNITCFIMQSSKTYEKWVVVNSKGIGKQSAAKLLCDNIKVKMKHVIYFGDSYNDLELIKSAGCGVAMKNALDDVKKKSMYISEYDNNNDGVYFFLKKLYKL